MKRLVPIFLCMLFACKKDHTQPDPVDPPVPEKKATTITVWDATQWSVGHPKGLPIEGATVELYATQQDYLAKKPALTATTDKNGVVTFADKKEGEYFIVAFKDQKTNTWTDSLGHTKVSDTLFQSFASINDPEQPKQSNTAKGDFMYKDLNGDGLINNTDVADAPFFKVLINDTIAVNRAVIIGYPVNHEGPALKTLDEIKAAFAIVAQEIGRTHQEYIMLDGVLSDEADASPDVFKGDWYEDWQRIDQFSITPSNTVIRRLWREHYASILKINKLMAELNRIAPGESKLQSQLYVFRALVHIDLLRYFGYMPLVEGTYIPDDIMRGAPEEVRYYIYRDLMNAFGAPFKAPAETPWYATRAAQFMLFAQLFMEIRDFQSAQMQTRPNPNHFKDYYALEDFSQVFISPANAETFWAISPALNSPFKEYFVKPGQTVNFFPVSRKTELYLLRALTFIAWGSSLGDGDTAEDNMRIVANRSGKTLGAINSVQDMIKELDKLYSSEFYREGYRYRFLHFTGQAAKVLGAKGYNSYHEHMPIPDSVMLNYRNMVQNPGYK